MAAKPVKPLGCIIQRSSFSNLKQLFHERAQRLLSSHIHQEILLDISDFALQGQPLRAI